MSNFYCKKCGTAIIDSPNGYITGCEHYPTALQTENKRLREALWKIVNDCTNKATKCNNCALKKEPCVSYTAKQALGE